jgi:hypothetical protein
LIGSIFSGNLTFDGEEHRATRIKEVINFIYLINNELKSKKNGQNHSKMTLPRVVGPLGICRLLSVQAPTAPKIFGGVSWPETCLVIFDGAQDIAVGF